MREVVERLIKEVDAQIDAKSGFVTAGKCLDMNQYARATGEIFGLRMALAILAEEIEKQNKIDG